MDFDCKIALVKFSVIGQILNWVQLIIIVAEYIVILMIGYLIHVIVQHVMDISAIGRSDGRRLGVTIGQRYITYSTVKVSISVDKNLNLYL